MEINKIISVLIAILVVLVAYRVYIEVYQIPVTYTKPLVEVNVSEPEKTMTEVKIVTAEKQVLFDESHQSLHSIFSDYSKFASLFGSSGSEVKASDGKLKGLSKINVLIIVAPNESYTNSEKEEIKNAVKNGITLIILGEASNSKVINELSFDFGLTFNNDNVYDLYNYSILYRNPIIPSFEMYAFTKNVSKIVIYEGCSMNTFGNALPVAFASNTSRSTLYGEEKLIVAALSVSGSGKIFAICDSDLFTNKNIVDFDNEVLARNLVNWS